MQGYNVSCYVQVDAYALKSFRAYYKILIEIH
jgi:hypothetical protein